MLVFLKVTDYNKIVKKDKSARRWSVAMTEQKHAIKPYPLGAHPEDGAIRFAYASGKKDCGIILYDRESGKKLHKIPFRREERMGNVYCKYLELDPQQIGYQFYEEERIVPDLHARGFLSKPVYGKREKMSIALRYFPEMISTGSRMNIRCFPIVRAYVIACMSVALPCMLPPR